eukprot:2867014-Pyramimonas_sp.AAC.1
MPNYNNILWIHASEVGGSRLGEARNVPNYISLHRPARASPVAWGRESQRPSVCLVRPVPERGLRKPGPRPSCRLWQGTIRGEAEPPKATHSDLLR